MNPIRPWLYIAKYRETRDHVLLQHYGVTAMLHLAADVQHPHIRTLYLPVEDGYALDTTVLRRGLDFVMQMHANDKTIVIACGAGISRSATFAIATLKEIEQLSLWDAYQVVKQQHADALPHPALWESLCAYYNEAVPFLDLLRYSNSEQKRNQEP